MFQAPGEFGSVKFMAFGDALCFFVKAQQQTQPYKPFAPDLVDNYCRH
jgi:hypothetical protein